MATSRQVKNLQSLLDVSKAMSGEIPLDNLLQVIVKKTEEVLDADRCSLFLYDEATDELWSKVAQGLGNVKEIRFPLNRGIAGSVAKTRTGINIPDAYNDTRFNAEIDKQTGYRTHSILCLPMTSSNGRLIGVIEVLNKQGGGHFDHEDEALLGALGTHAAIALERAQLIEAYVAKQRTDAALKLAHDIQMSLLPQKFPPFPEIAQIDLYAAIQPAWEVGGDLYDFFLTDQGLIFFAIGDVAGKGVPASLFMAITRTLIKVSARKGLQPHEILYEVNAELCCNNDSCTFVTLFCGTLDPVTGNVCYASAGHNPPLVVRPSQALVYLDDGGGMAAGILEKATYQTHHLHLNAGDSLFLYTDGVTEAMNRKRELFSEKRLIRKMDGLQKHSSEEIVTAILETISKFSKGVPQGDDITLMNLKMKAG
jgi:sigma-B regulation protein RsbU (phosphoserine phosphatase)